MTNRQELMKCFCPADGKPGSKIRERIARLRKVDIEIFTPGVVRAYYYANAAEAASCWPRVINKTMSHDRFHERIERMQAAIENSGLAD